MKNIAETKRHIQRCSRFHRLMVDLAMPGDSSNGECEVFLPLHICKTICCNELRLEDERYC